MAKMVWFGGELVPGTRCEDAPCCGCCGPGTDDPTFAEPYEPDPYEGPMEGYDEESEDEECPDCGEPGEQRGHMECQYPSNG